MSALVGLSVTPAFAVNTNPAFPRLAMWWPNNDTQSAASRARYDWIELQNADAPHIAELRAINPGMVIMAANNARELNYRLGDYNDPLNVELRSASTDWMLTQVGSKLTSNVTASTTSIPVADTSKFGVGEMALVDHELVHVDSIGSGVLNVTRGQVTPTASHSSGARIASVVSAWPGGVEYDVTANCPLADVGHGPETFNQWNARRAATVLASGDWNGVTVDCYDGSLSWMVSAGLARSIDPNRSNVAPSSYSAFDSAWNAGMVSYGNTLRAAVGPNAIIVANNAVRNYALNGRNFEDFPAATTSLATWNQRVIGPDNDSSVPSASYLDWVKNAAQPNFSTIETYEYDGSPQGTGWSIGGFVPSWFTPNYQKMRYGLTTALMGNGYFSYEISTDGHGKLGLMWFDEYDNAGAGKGYLGQPTAAAVQVGSAWRRDFDNGVAIVNPSASTVTVQLGGTFRKIHGTQAPAVNDGSLVTAVTLKPQDGIVVLRVAAPVTYTLTYAPGSGGTISGTALQTVNSGASGSAVTAVPASGYHFVNWSDGLTTATRTDANVTHSVSVSASFAVNTYTLTYTAGSGGTISGSSPQTVNAGASGAAVAAVPSSGYHFVKWSDNVTSATRTDAGVTANLSVSASFAADPLPTYTLTYTASAGGTVSGTAVQTVNSGASGTAVTAVPASGFQFAGWSDGLTSATRTDAGVTASLSVIADFTAITDPVSTPPDPTTVVTATLTPYPSTITYRQSTSLRVQTSVAGAYTVEIDALGPNGTQWATVQTLTTDATGFAQSAVTPLVNTQYRVVILDSGFVSDPTTVTVKAVTTIHGSKRTVRRSASFTISGTVLATGSVTVVLQRSEHGKWKTVKHLSTTAAGRYAARVRSAASRGIHRYRVLVVASAGIARTASSLLRVLVR